MDRGKLIFTANCPEGEDGQTTKVYVRSCPAKFYTIVAEEGVTSTGEKIPGFVLATGSGNEMCDLAKRIAKAASEGMIGIEIEGVNS